MEVYHYVNFGNIVFFYLVHIFYYDQIFNTINEQGNSVMLSGLYFTKLPAFLPAIPACHLFSSILPETEIPWSWDSLADCPGDNLIFNQGVWNCMRAQSVWKRSAVDMTGRTILKNNRFFFLQKSYIEDFFYDYVFCYK